MILLLVFYIYSVATSPTSDTGLSRNVTIDLKNDACTNRRIKNESIIITPEKLKDPEMPFNTTNLPAFMRVKRQLTTLSPAEQKLMEEQKKLTDNLKDKQINLMVQAMYATQEVIWPVEPIFKHYEKEVGYRMAFIFMKLFTLMREARSMIKLIETKRTIKPEVYNPTQRLQIYWQLVKKNMDVTYLVDYISQRVPVGTEGRDTTIPPPPTSPSNDTEDTNIIGQDSTIKPRLRRPYFGKRFKHNRIRPGVNRLGRVRNFRRLH